MAATIRKNAKLLVYCATIFIANITTIAFILNIYASSRNYIYVDKVKEPIGIVSDKFLSIGIDTSQIEHLDNLKLNTCRIKEFATLLSPAYLRIGGTLSERLVFSEDPENLPSCEYCSKNSNTAPHCQYLIKSCGNKDIPLLVMNGAQWTNINHFSKSAGLSLLFSVNALLRDDNGWDPTNLKDLLEYSRFNKFNDINFQLGNEPNSFEHHFNVTVSPQQLGDDFVKLRKVLNENGYEKSLIVGPDTTRPQPKRPECLKYMVEFLPKASSVLDARSWHQYYLNSRTAKLEDFWNPDTLDLLKLQIEIMKQSTDDYDWIPMWLTETSSSYGGGAPGLSDSFAGVALWLDKLGLAAANNISVVIRQSFLGGNYNIIGRDLEPLPDWWVSLLFKRLVGTRVLPISLQSSKYQRFYCHCTNRAYSKDSNNTITIYGINLSYSRARLFLNGTAINTDKILADEFLITSPLMDRRSTKAMLNGEELHFVNELPAMKPRLLKFPKHITMAPYSVGFWVIRNTDIYIC